MRVFVCSSDEPIQCNVSVNNLIYVSCKEYLQRTLHDKHIDLCTLYLKLLLRDDQLEKQVFYTWNILHSK